MPLLTARRPLIRAIGKSLVAAPSLSLAMARPASACHRIWEACFAGINQPSAEKRELKDAPQPVLGYLTNYALSGPHASLASATDIMTKIAYIPPGRPTVTLNGRNYYDHSEKGIDLSAQRIASLILSRSTKFALLDIEQFTSMNVPEVVGYNAQSDADLAARYDPGARSALRQEARRYHVLLISKVKHILGEDQLEIGEYNIPRSLNWYHRDDYTYKSYVTSLEDNELNGYLLPQLSFTGPPAQILIDRQMSDQISNGIITDQMLIDWHAESVNIRRKTLGDNVRIMPVIWPRLYTLGGAKYPNNSVALRPNFMSKLCNALLDSGAQGFICWTPSEDNGLSNLDQQSIARSWEEVVQVARSRGFRAVL